jgi:hypothetical protein
MRTIAHHGACLCVAFGLLGWGCGGDARFTGAAAETETDKANGDATGVPTAATPTDTGTQTRTATETETDIDTDTGTGTDTGPDDTDDDLETGDDDVPGLDDLEKPPVDLPEILAKPSTTIRAKTDASLGLYKSGFAHAADVAVDASDFPAGTAYDAAAGTVRWPSDLQDAGKTYEGPFAVRFSGHDFASTWKLTITEPQITTRECSFTPPPVIGGVAPEQKWHWNGWTNAAGQRYWITYSSPVVADLDQDGSVEVVTIPSTGTYSGLNGPVVVLDGKTGASMWNTLEGPTPQGAGVSQTPSLIDLDGTGKLEIVAVAFTTGSAKEILAFDYATKSVRWRYADGFVCDVYCLTAVGDIDGDGKPEVAAGNKILNWDGTLKATLSPAPATGVYPSTVVLAELVATSAGLEVIVNGSQVYAAEGARLWAGDCKGYAATSDIDRDGDQELVCVGDGNVVVYNSDGTLAWSKPIPKLPDNTSANAGGAPNIGNFTGDEAFEIGTAGGDYYVVYDKTGTILWQTVTTDRSSHRTGSTIYDFNGDGLVEVVYNDEQKLRIYNGSTGEVLWETANRSGTLWEYPVVANVDDDASVEIVVSAPSLGGVRVFDDPNNLWVASRRIWNQYSYYPELVSNAGKAVADPGVPKIGFRVNTQGSPKKNGKILLSDLALTAPRFADDVEASPAPTEGAVLTLWVTNRGEAEQPEAATLKVFAADGAVVGTARTPGALAPGAGVLVKVESGSPHAVLEGDLRATIDLDDAGAALTHECEDANNTLAFKLESLAR